MADDRPAESSVGLLSDGKDDMTTHRLIRARVAMATMAVGTLVLTAACSPGGQTVKTDAPSSAASPAGIVTDVSTLGEVTLTVWDVETQPGPNDELIALNEAFQAKYPNITIKRNSQSFDDLIKTLRLALTGPDAPDVVQSNNGRSQMGEFVKAGQIISVEPYAAAYGWKDRFPESVLNLASYSADGTAFGSGNLYGLPQMGEMVGVFYNKQKLADLGLEVPTTWAEFTEDLATIKNSGDTPLMLGDLEKWPAIHVFGPIQGANTPASDIMNLGLGNPGGDWMDANNTAAATELANWVTDGYFNADVLGSNNDDTVAKFGTGTGVFLMAGSWNTASLDAQMGDNVGFFAPPPAVAGEGSSTTGGTSLPFTITSASKNPDAAAAYIDFITSDEAMKVIAEKGNLPVLNSAKLAPASSAAKDVYTAYESVTTQGNLLPYLDYATPTFSDTLGAALQDLIAGKQTPQQFTQTLQDDYAAFTKK